MKYVLRLVAGLGAAFALALVPAGSAQAAAGSPFDPTVQQIFASKSSGGAPTTLFSLDESAGSYSFTAIGAQADLQYNALAFNPDDNYLYAMVVEGNQDVPVGALIKIGSSGTYERVGTETFDAGPGATYNMGAIESGEFWILSAQGTTMRIIDVDPGSATYGEEMSGSPITTADVHNDIDGGSDFAFSGGELFTLGRSGIFRINADGTSDNWPVPAGAESNNAPTDVAGAAWTLLGDDLGFSYNGSGQVVRIRVTNPSSANPTFTVLSNKGGQGSSANDGAAIAGTADLAITKTGELINNDTQVRYVITVSNLGSADSSGWSLSDTLPSGLENITVSGDGSPSVSGSSLSASGPFLEVGDTRVVTVIADVGDADSLENTAEVTGNDPDPNLANNISTVQLDLPADPDDPADPAAPDTGTERTPMWPAYGALGAGLLLAAGLGGRQLLGRRED